MTGRLACCVPGCRRTVEVGRFREWVCGRHWPLVAPRLRRRYNMAKRLEKRASQRFLRQYAAQGNRFHWPQHRRWEVMRDLTDRLWQRCKVEAIERAMGI